jgi:S1-C subfamily serine protease
VVAALLLLSGIGIGWGISRSGSDAPASATKAPLTPIPAASPSGGQANQGLNVQAIAAKVEPAVVDVNVMIANPVGGSAEGAGTGMVITSTGEILTNHHVVQGATKIEITFQDRAGTYAARVVGVDLSRDVALLQVDGLSGLPTVSITDSSSLSVSQAVVAIGNALGHGGEPTVTQGTISALNQSITVSDGRGGTERLSGMIQADAPIQPGDSGGPLVNSAGQVVGMITAGARAGRLQAESTIGFAIPSSTALSVVNEIRAGHESSSILIGPVGFLGVGVRDLESGDAARLGLNVNSGGLVVSVSPGSPAARAGLKRNSVITAIDGRNVSTVDELGAAIHQHDPGDTMTVTWVDSGGSHTATVTLISGPTP